jgi:hypothetical protein
VLVLLADGPLAGREIELAEPRPTIEVSADARRRRSRRGVLHRYRLADVELRWRPGDGRRFRVAIYVHAPDAARDSSSVWPPAARAA